MFNAGGSLLNRLQLEEPSMASDRVRGWVLGAVEERHARLLLSVRSDLVRLLSTPMAYTPTLAARHGLEGSLLDFGLPDLGDFDLSSEGGRSAFRAAITRAIRRFEPRLRNAVVGEPIADRRGRLMVEIRADLVGAGDRLDPVVLRAALDRVNVALDMD